MSKYTYLPEMR